MILTVEKSGRDTWKLVWLLERLVGVFHTLKNKWKGPYLVTRKLADLIYLVQRSPNQPIRAHHLDRLLPYHGRNIPQWVSELKMKKMKKDLEGSGKTGSWG